MKSVTKLKEKCVNIFKLPGRQIPDTSGHPEYRGDWTERESENWSFLFSMLQITTFINKQGLRMVE